MHREASPRTGAPITLGGDLALHGVRVLGFPTSSRIAGRFGLSPGAVQEALLDFEARGWVRQLSFAGQSGWSLTDAGRAENERRLAAELDRAGARDAVTRAHATFVPLNRRFGAACTDWQIRPTQFDSMAFNDHADWRWDDRVLRTLASVATTFRLLCAQLFADPVDVPGRREAGDVTGSADVRAHVLQDGPALAEREKLLVLRALQHADHAPGDVVVDRGDLAGPPDQPDDREGSAPMPKTSPTHRADQ